MTHAHHPLPCGCNPDHRYFCPEATILLTNKRIVLSPKTRQAELWEPGKHPSPWEPYQEQINAHWKSRLLLPARAASCSNGHTAKTDPETLANTEAVYTLTVKITLADLMERMDGVEFLSLFGNNMRQVAGAERGANGAARTGAGRGDEKTPKAPSAPLHINVQANSKDVVNRKITCPDCGTEYKAKPKGRLPDRCKKCAKKREKRRLKAYSVQRAEARARKLKRGEPTTMFN